MNKNDDKCDASDKVLLEKARQERGHLFGMIQSLEGLFNCASARINELEKIQVRLLDRITELENRK